MMLLYLGNFMSNNAFNAAYSNCSAVDRIHYRISEKKSPREFRLEIEALLRAQI